MRLPGRLLGDPVTGRGLRRRGVDFDPHDPAAIAAAVAAVLDDPEPWRARGMARAAAFTWDRTAAAHEDIYRELGA